MVLITFAVITLLGLICLNAGWRSTTEGTRSRQIFGVILLLIGIALAGFGGVGLYRVATRPTIGVPSAPAAR
jgi:hypothetical protein